MSNGFLIAEIFSWYYPEDIRISAFNTGLSLDSKMTNWSIIKRVIHIFYSTIAKLKTLVQNIFSSNFKFVSKKSLNIPIELIDETMHCKEGAAIILIENMFQLLTNRP